MTGLARSDPGVGLLESALGTCSLSSSKNLGRTQVFPVHIIVIIIGSLPSSEITLTLLVRLVISVLSSETLAMDSVRTILAAENIFSVIKHYTPFRTVL